MSCNLFDDLIEKHFSVVDQVDLPGLREATLAFQHALISRALQLSNNNVAEAGRLLNLNRTTLAEMCNREIRRSPLCVPKMTVVW